MWFLIAITVAILALIVLLGYGILYFATGQHNKSFWPSRSVFLINMDHIIPFWDRLTLKVPIYDMDNEMYRAFKYRHGIRSFGGVMQLGKPLLVLLDPDLVKQVTVKDFDSFVDRRSNDLSKSEPMFNQMLLNKSGDDWRSMRATLSPTFSTGKIKRMFSIFNESALKTVAYIKQQAEGSGTWVGDVEIVDPASKFTLDVIASAAFGLDSQVFQDSNSNFATCAKIFSNSFAGFKFFKLMLLLMAPKLLNTLRISLLDKKALSFFQDVIRDTIKHRKATGEKRDDFLQLLIEAQAEELKESAEDATARDMDNYDRDAQLKTKTKTQPLTDEVILAQAILFFSAGSDTTSVLIIRALYELALNPEVQDRLHSEVQAAIDDNDGRLDYERLNTMNYLDMFVSEVLRKYPPGIRNERQCTAHSYKLPGSDLTIEKGQIVLLPVYGYHMDEEYFPNPTQFNPEHFTEEAKAKRHPYVYQPFGHGPRNCIARRFALLEGKTAVAQLVYNFIVEPCAKTVIPPKTRMNTGFKPSEGLWLNFKSRST